MDDIIEDLIVKMTRSTRLLILVGSIYAVLFTLSLIKANSQSERTINIGRNNEIVVRLAVQNDRVNH